MTATYPRVRGAEWWPEALSGDDLHEQPIPAVERVGYDGDFADPPSRETRDYVLLQARKTYHNRETFYLFYFRNNGPQDNVADIVWLGPEHAEWHRSHVFNGQTVPSDADLRRLKEQTLPRLRQGIPVETASYDVAGVEPFIDAHDAYEQLRSLYGRGNSGLFQHAGLLGTQFHNGITRTLMHQNPNYAATCGLMSMNVVRQDRRGDLHNPEAQRLQRAKDALIIRPFPPLADMCTMVLRELKKHVERHATEYEVLATEFQVWFTYAMHVLTNKRRGRGQMHETAVDAVIR